jgi:hypothetical protein
MQQIEVLLSTLASSFHGISRASLVEGGEEAEEAELRGYPGPKKKKVKIEEEKVKIEEEKVKIEEEWD